MAVESVISNHIQQQFASFIQVLKENIDQNIVKAYLKFLYTDIYPWTNYLKKAAEAKMLENRNILVHRSRAKRILGEYLPVLIITILLIY
jgi:hypothetical protein